MAKHSNSPLAVAETIRQNVRIGMVIQLRNLPDGQFEDYTVEKIRRSGTLETRNAKNAFRLVKPKHTLKALNLHFSQLEASKAESEKEAAELQERHRKVMEGDFTEAPKPTVQRVKWSYQSGGKSFEREGEVIATVPVDTLPQDVVGSDVFQSKTTRKHESYLVYCPENKEVYWPIVSKLVWMD